MKQTLNGADLRQMVLNAAAAVDNNKQKKEAEENKKTIEEKNKELVFYQTVTKVWELYESGDTAGAEEAFAGIDLQTLTDTQRESYDVLKTILNN